MSARSDRAREVTREAEELRDDFDELAGRIVQFVEGLRRDEEFEPTARRFRAYWFAHLQGSGAGWLGQFLRDGLDELVEDLEREPEEEEDEEAS